jgi:hypothetical protein
MSYQELPFQGILRSPTIFGGDITAVRKIPAVILNGPPFRFTGLSLARDLSYSFFGGFINTGGAVLRLVVNGDTTTTNYSRHGIFRDPTAGYSLGDANDNGFTTGIPAGNRVAAHFVMWLAESRCYFSYFVWATNNCGAIGIGEYIPTVTDVTSVEFSIGVTSGRVVMFVGA